MMSKTKTNILLAVVLICVFALFIYINDNAHVNNNVKKLENKVELGDRRIQMFYDTPHSKVGKRVNLWLKNNEDIEVKNIDTEVSDHSGQLKVLVTVYYIKTVP